MKCGRGGARLIRRAGNSVIAPLAASGMDCVSCRAEPIVGRSLIAKPFRFTKHHDVAPGVSDARGARERRRDDVRESRRVLRRASAGERDLLPLHRRVRRVEAGDLPQPP